MNIRKTPPNYQGDYQISLEQCIPFGNIRPFTNASRMVKERIIEREIGPRIPFGSMCLLRDRPENIDTLL
ncbi:uncharacterized protein ANIA_11424 [Aspergillus nidulans FGSC A4]|uniref:Uncharacterized protein n=1 Tax=Emericella nidulans (strain FGSC A4 / ATCC 38163 / CBS 112.46 / NRRL 194 / M139) TaxID=227321 RepID=C8V5R2_EMENI|nr:hypothetical protein [Aspergillus nidulans FGSC A4]CBF74903.1 TPA: hypothetical protein ANIA_11424 [Aspergillus nidulans FGSC A4]